MNVKKKRGFVTLAVGHERYYRLAANLLKSYRKFSGESDTPFAIYADCENEYTALFDNVVLLTNATKTYIDKLHVLNNPLYTENIFIDADCLIYADINEYWLYVSNLGGIRCFGCAHPLDFENGWFRLSDVGEYKERVSYIPTMHGGVIYFSDDVLSQRIVQDAFDIAKKYSNYKFAYFDKPADEPILALACSVNHCLPIELESSLQKRMFCFLPSCSNVYFNIQKGRLCYEIDGEIVKDVLLLHWQNVNTTKIAYYSELLALTLPTSCFIVKKIKFLIFVLKYYGVNLSSRVQSKIKRIFKIERT